MPLVVLLGLLSLGQISVWSTTLLTSNMTGAFGHFHVVSRNKDASLLSQVGEEDITSLVLPWQLQSGAEVWEAFLIHHSATGLSSSLKRKSPQAWTRSRRCTQAGHAKTQGGAAWAGKT